MNDEAMGQIFEAVRASLGSLSPAAVQLLLEGSSANWQLSSSNQLSTMTPTTSSSHQASPCAEAQATSSTHPSEYNSDYNKVKHDYHDRSGDPDGDYMAVHELLQKSGGGACVDQSFPVKLHYMLNEMEKDGQDNIVGWQPHGRCFLVKDQKLFVEKILGSWFRQKKYPSFQRQLNIYGFQRLTAGPDKGAYYHELFLRGKPGLAYRIQRFKFKGTGTRKASSPQTEPNFYAMKPLPNTDSKSAVKKKQTGHAQTVAQQEPLERGASTAAALSSTNVGSTSNSTAAATTTVTLQNIAPSLFSPASFQTTIHNFPDQSATSTNEKRFMVTSSSPLVIKTGTNPTTGGVAPITLSSATNPRLATLNQNANNSALLAALSAEKNFSLPFRTNSSNASGTNQNRNNPLWFLR